MPPASGDSPEDAARRARYATLARLARDHGLPNVALAQHADDQVETMLIALGRGAGLDGLAAMPREMTRHGVQFHRPLLDVRADALRGWLVAAQVAFIDDPSNADARYTRNRIRHHCCRHWPRRCRISRDLRALGTQCGAGVVASGRAGRHRPG